MADQQVNILLSWRQSGQNVITEAQKQVNNFAQTLQRGLTLGIGINLANDLLQLPGRIKAIVDAGIQYATTAQNMAQQTRMTASEFQVMGLLANQSGMQVNLLMTAIQHMSQMTQEAIDGNVKIGEAFRELGINAEQFSGLNVPQQLEALADAAQQAGWSTQSLNDIGEILGRRSGPQLESALHILATEGFAGVSDQAIKMGAVLSDQVTAQVAQTGYTIKTTQQAWKVAWGDMAYVLKPVIDLINNISDFLATGIQASLIRFEIYIQHVVDVFRAARDIIEGKDNTRAGGGKAASDRMSLWSQYQAYAAQSEGDVLANMLPTVTPSKGSPLAPDSNSQGKADAAAYEATWKSALAAIKTAQEANAKDAKASGADLAAAWETTWRDLQADIKGGAAAQAEALKQQQEVLEAKTIPLEEQLSEVEKNRAAINENGLLDANTKQTDLNANADEYRRIVTQIIALEQQRLKLTSDPVEIARLQAEIARLRSEAKDYGDTKTKPTKGGQAMAGYAALSKPDQHFQDAGFGSAKDPGALGASMLDIMTKAGTLADQVNEHFKEIASTISGSITSNLDGVIERTTSWHTAISNIGHAIENSIVNSLVQMATSFVETAIMAKLLAIVWGPAAFAAATATAGGAAVAGMAAVQGGMGMAFAAEGGVFDGDPREVRGVFHGGEGIVKASSIRMPGVAAVVHALNDGDYFGALASLADGAYGRLGARVGSPGGGGLAGAKSSADQGNTLGILVSDDRQEIARQMRSRPGQKSVIETVRNNLGEFFA